MRVTVLSATLGFLIMLTGPCMANENQDSQSEQDAAFERSLQEQLPLTPEQIINFKKRMNATQQATHERKPPRMSSRTKRLVFDTGHEPPVIRIAPGYVTTLSFFDSTGQPWPLTSVVVGNAEYYDIQRPEGEESTITISAKQKHVDSNLALTFKDQNMPVTVQLTTVPDGEDTDSIVAFRAEARGPNAEQPTIGPGVEKTISNTMMSFLDLIPPHPAKYINTNPKIDGIDLWDFEGKLYLRTEYPLMWPAWTSITRGPQEVSVYELPYVTSLLLSRDGRSVSVEIMEEDNDR